MGSASDTSNYIFVGPSIKSYTSLNGGNGSLKSRIMREHYRKKRAAKAEQEARKASLAHQNPSRRAALPRLVPRGAPNNPFAARDSTSSPITSEDEDQTQDVNMDLTASMITTSSESEHFPSNLQMITFQDPKLQEVIQVLQPAARKQFWRYFTLATDLFDLSVDIFTCKAYTMALVTRFPVLVHAYTAFSSRQSAVCNSDADLAAISLRHHNHLVKVVNHQITKPSPENYAIILLGIQGAMASAFAGGDKVEFAIHRKGQSRFLRMCGIPTDPDLMNHMVANSLMFGRGIIDPLFDDSWDLTPTAITDADRVYDTMELMTSAYELTGLLRTIQCRSVLSRHELQAIRSENELGLYAPGSVLRYMLREPFDPNRVVSEWREQFDIGHYPFMVIYLTLWQCEMAQESLEAQETEYKSFAQNIRVARIAHTSGPATVNWLLIVKYTHLPERSFRAYRFLQVLLKLSRPHRAVVLALLVWNLSLDMEPPSQAAGTIDLLVSDVMRGL